MLFAPALTGLSGQCEAAGQIRREGSSKQDPGSQHTQLPHSAWAGPDSRPDRQQRHQGNDKGK